MSDTSGTVGKARANSTVFCHLLNAESDGEEMTSAGRVFHTRATDRGKGAVTDGGQTCRGDDECGRRRLTIKSKT